jgi:phosphonate transport system substrate-binding protein
MRRTLVVFACLVMFATGAARAADRDCPNGGTVRLGFVPGEDTELLLPIYRHIGERIAKPLGCNVEVITGISYTAVIEAMRAHQVEVGAFGAFSYVLAHKVAGAEAVSTYPGPDGKPGSYFATITTWPGSGITSLEQVRGKPFVFADPASTSGHLIPGYALKKIGIDPDHDIRPFYSGSHTASFEVLANHKAPVGELNSTAIAAARNAGRYHDADFVRLWKSPPIPNGPFAVRADLPPAFKARLVAVLQTLDLGGMPDKDLAFINKRGVTHLVAIDDAAYDPIRDVVSVLHLDLAHMGE